MFVFVDMTLFKYEDLLVGLELIKKIPAMDSLCVYIMKQSCRTSGPKSR